MQRLARELFLLYGIGFVFFLVSCEKHPSSMNYFPESGRNALYQRSLDLRSNLNVLSIAIQPGYEDLCALSYFRLGRGAKIVSAYITNGEAGESDVQEEYPPYLSAIRRREASNAVSYIGGEVHFLNMPDIASARDSRKVRELWQSDTLQTRLTRLISEFRPDIVIVARDWTSKDKSPRWEVLCSDVRAAVEKHNFTASDKSSSRSTSRRFWSVSRVFIDGGDEKGISIPINVPHPRWRKTYKEIGEESARMYASLAIQRRMWMKDEEPSYSLVFPDRPLRIQKVDEGLPERFTGRLGGVERQIDDLTRSTLKGKTKGAINRLATLKDSISFYIQRRYTLSERENRAVFEWNRGLESLRCTLLGVEVKYSISETELTDRQLTFLTVDEVKGITNEGKTDIYFADMEPGWAINEDTEKRLPLKLHEKYRLLTPGNLDYTFPPAQFKQRSSTFGKALTFYIVHRAPSREKSFIHRTTVELSYGPKFVTEILTPIVRMVPGERVVVRLKNLSRDGVADTIRVENPLGRSKGSAFRMSYKESSHLDTLFLAWKGNPSDGNYLIPVKIGEFTIAHFVARKFHVEVDTSKKIGIIAGLKNSSVENALRRMNVNFSNVGLDRTFSQQIDTLDVLVIDRRLLTLKPQVAGFKDEIDHFVNRGGHLIIMAQDAGSWNEKPLWEGLHLKPTYLFDENIPLQVDYEHTLLKSPNIIEPEDWDGWLYSRAYNVLSGKVVEEANLPVKAKQEDVPLIVSGQEGRGKRTYVDFALGYQLMNIHSGAFKLFANLISY